VWGMTLLDVEIDVDGTETVIGPRDLTGYSARMQIRQKQGAEIQIDANTTNEKIVLGRVAYGDDPGDDDPSNGRLMVVFTDEESDVFTIKKGVYDLEIVDPVPSPAGYTTRIAQGTVTISPNITQILPPTGNDEVL